MGFRDLLIRGGKLAWLVALAACSAATTETPGGLPALDATAQSRRYGAMMEAFESNMSGQPAVWAESDRVRGSVIPLTRLIHQRDGDM